MKLIRDEAGLSVVVGVLLLILVVVASVSAIALMTSQTQKKQIEQKSLRDAVASENVTILSLALSGPDNGSLNTINITVVNLNKEESRIVGLNINGSSSIFLNLTSNLTPPLNISKNQPIQVILFTSLTNKFERDFLPPVAIIKANVKPAQSGSNYVLYLDGSDSFDREGTIVDYRWLVRYTNSTNSTNSTNGTWTNGTRNNYSNITVGPHGWSNITVFAYNSSGAGTLNMTPVSQNTQVINNVPVQAPIGSKNVTAGNLLTFNVSTTDLDNDTITYGTNATNGTLNTTTGNYSWLTTTADNRTYVWYFNSSDNYGGIATENVTVSVN